METVDWIMYRNGLRDYLKYEQTYSLDEKASIQKEIDKVDNLINGRFGAYQTD